MLGRSFLGSLGRSVGPDFHTTCNLRVKGDPTGVCRLPLRFLSKFLSYEKGRIQLLMAL